MILVRATAETEAGVMPTPEAFAAMSDFNRELMEAGILLQGEGLKASSAGKRVRIEGERRIVTDGPFAETREVIAGFSLWRVRDLAEAMAWAERCPNPTSGTFEIEVRPLLDAEDFGDAITPEIAEQERRFRPPISDY